MGTFIVIQTIAIKVASVLGGVALIASMFSKKASKKVKKIVQ